MKKIKTLVVLAFLTLGVLGASAQTNFGVKAGLNVATVTGLDNSKYIPAFNAGVFTQHMFNEGFGLEAGLYYSMLGYKLEAKEGGISVSSTQRASYLQLPVQLLYKFNVGQSLYLYPSLGVYAGYGLGGTETLGIKYFDGANKFDFGVIGGINVQYDRFIIGVGYQRGLTKFNEEKIPGMDNLFNSNVMVSVGYLF